jgi:hypothetical protein
VLFIMQKIYRKAVAALEGLEATCGVTDANQYEGGIEREGGERVIVRPRGRPTSSTVVTMVMPVTKFPSVRRSANRSRIARSFAIRAQHRPNRIGCSWTEK